MTDQEVFNRVALHLLQQNHRSADALGTCSYRGEEGRRCAVGCLIPDDRYMASLEGLAVTAPKLQSLLRGLGFGSHQLDLLQTLQSLHDFNPASTWKQRLMQTAEDYNLDPQVVQNYAQN